MMHKKNFVAAIKVDGKVLRESSDRVELPFGSEYSVLLKNLDTVRMQAKIDIDGQDASGWVVLEPGQSVDVERFYRQNRDRGNRFKFIERTESVENHRGVKAEDGLIRVEFKREKVYDAPKIVEHHTYHHHSWPYTYKWHPISWNTLDSYSYGGLSTTGTATCGTGLSANVSRSRSLSGDSGERGLQKSSGPSGQSVSAFNMAEASVNMQRSNLGIANDAGITVEGSLSTQRFLPVAGFECEASEAIVLHLVGRIDAQPIRVAKTVAQRPVCDTCGKKNKGIAKFCIHCGTSLEKF